MRTSLLVGHLKTCTLWRRHSFSYTKIRSLRKSFIHRLCYHPLFALLKYSASILTSQWMQFNIMMELKDTPLQHLHFHARCRLAKLPLNCYRYQDKLNMVYWREVSKSARTKTKICLLKALATQ